MAIQNCTAKGIDDLIVCQMESTKITKDWILNIRNKEIIKSKYQSVDEHQSQYHSQGLQLSQFYQWRAFCTSSLCF